MLFLCMHLFVSIIYSSTMFNTLQEWDRELFLLINSHHNSFFDIVMYWASDKLFWIPFYAFLLFIVIRQFKKKSILVILHIAALITASDQIASGLIKNTVKRLRPSREPSLEGLVHLSSAGKGGLYGFISSHASNSFALFVFLSIVLPHNYRPLKWILFFWASLIAYSRVYNGVHYPGDVLVAALLGSLLALVFSRLYFYLKKKWK